ncbi:MAG TPA: D-glycero-beta-D-manno-heptose-7-phosphate kinase [Candidatus Acidoferrales bacterium]|nr:D-glycero-beta-D-manno-heptose-7-phosphate kinase [Candidatus Acidoferrales bacterium]
MSTTSFALGSLNAVLERFAGRRLLVLGDVMLDHYLWGRCERISPEAPVPVVDVQRESSSLGGAGNVAANLAALGAEPLLVGVLGQDAHAQQMLDAFAARGVATRGLVRDPSRPTTFKTRIIAQHQQVVRADWESRADVSGAALRDLLETLAREMPRCEALVVSDYGKGVVSREVVERAIALAHAQGAPIAVDPKESHIDAYRGVSVLTPNQQEAGWVMGRRIVDEASLMEVGWGLQKRLDCECALVTRGADGMSLFERGGRYSHLPTVAREVFDVTGAGDTVVSVVALALAAGADYPEACYLANHAAGLVIREVGTATCSLEQLRASLAGAPA